LANLIGAICKRSQKPEARSQKPEARSQKPVRRLAAAIVFSITTLFTALPFSYSVTEVSQNWTLDSDFRGSLRLNGTSDPTVTRPFINLNGHKITIDAGGIQTNQGMFNSEFTGGTLTSSESSLIVKYSGKEYNSIVLNLTIANSDHQIGLRVEGHDHAHSGLFLLGTESNTFTGNVEVSGWRKHLVLRKSNGAIAVRSDILVREEAVLRFEGDNQLSKTSNIELRSNSILQTLLKEGNEKITNTFKNLTVEDGGVIHFSHEGSEIPNAKNYIKIDDLIINLSGHLEIKGWQEKRDFLLVRKNSANLADALTKMNFAGYDLNAIHLEDFDANYWSISSTPEPATTGAILGTAGLGLWIWRRRSGGKGTECSTT